MNKKNVQMTVVATVLLIGASILASYAFPSDGEDDVTVMALQLS